MPGSPARCGFAAPVPSGSGISLPRSPASVPDGSSNGEALLGVLTLCQFVHAQVVGRPPFRVAVWGAEPEDADRSVAGQVQDGARGADGHFVKGPGTAISGVTLRLPFSRVSQSQPLSRICLRFSRLAYQQSKSTYFGEKPRPQAIS